MRLILSLIFICAAVVGAAWWIGHLNGVASVEIGDTMLQAPLSITFLALIGLMIAVYIVTRLFLTIFGLPGTFRRGAAARRRRQGDDAVTSALVALAARDSEDARTEAARATRLLGETPQTLLLSAYAGSISGDDAEAEAAFHKLAETKNAAFLGLRGLLRLAISQQDFGRAAELARLAEAARPGAAWLRTERTQLALRTGNWSEAFQLTHEDAPKAGFGAAAAEIEENPTAAHKLAKQAFKRDPGLPAAAIAYARRLRAGNRERAAQDVLRRCWSIAPNPEIADFYLAPAPDKRARLQAGLDLVKSTPGEPEGELLLARLSLDAGLIADAQRHLDVARAKGLDERRVHLLQADICEAEGDAGGQREALRSAAMAPPDPGWRCEGCGSTLESWSPACPVCHAAGRVKWGLTARAVQAPLLIGSSQP
jgi:HemY protein